MGEMTAHRRTQRHAATEAAPRNHHWPLLLIAAPAAVAIWSGWVGLASMCGFGIVHPLPGIFDSVRINTAITLPIGVEAYGAYALWVWLSGRGSEDTRTWARNSAFGALALGCLGQVAFHLLAAAHWTEAPWPVVVAVACLPVVTLAFAATLIHMTRADVQAAVEAAPEVIPEVAAEAVVQVTPEPVSRQVPEPVTGQPEVAVRVRPQVRPRRKTPVRPPRISDADLKKLVRAEFEKDRAVSVIVAAKNLNRGRDRVAPLLKEVRREAGILTMERKQA